MKGSRAAGYAAIFGLALIWGCNWTIVKIAIAYTTPFAFSLLRALVGTVVMFVILIWMRRSLRATPFVPTAIIGLTATTVFFIGQAISVMIGAAGKATVLFYCFPFMIAVIARATLRERIAAPTAVGLVLALIGILALAAPSIVAHAAVLPVVIPLVTALVWAAGAVYTKWVRTELQLDLLGLTAWQNLYGTIPLAIVAGALPSQHVVWTLPLVGALLYTGILATAIAMILWIFALDRLAVSAAGLASLLTPLVSILAAWFVLGEVPTPIETFGIACIVLALIVHGLPELSLDSGASRLRSG